MGGNTRAIDRSTGEVITFFGRPAYADKIDLNRVNRAAFKKSIIDALKKLDKIHQDQTGEPIWDPQFRNSILSSGEAFNGSSEHLFNDNITDKEFKTYKSKVGDIDLTVPEQHLKSIYDMLSTLEGSQIISNKVWYIGQNKKTVPSLGQINALFAYKQSAKDEPVFVQIDFEALPYEEGKPTEFTKFGHSSAWEDIKQGIKGAFHKLLLRSITTGSKISDAVILTKTSPLYPPEKVKIAKRDYPVKLLTFSVGEGLRTSVELQYYPDVPGIPPELVGEPVKINGKLAYKEIPPSESTYEKSIPEIISLVFNVEPTEEDVSLFRSFTGILELFSKYLNQSQIKEIYDDFVYDKLFCRGCQGISATSPEEDREAKLGAVNKFVEVFSFLPPVEMSTLEEYYGSYKIRQEALLRRYVSLLLGS
jgi:hypothetical protein